MPGRVQVPKVIEVTLRPFISGNLQVNGIQYSQIYNASTLNTYVATNSGVFNVLSTVGYPGHKGELKEIEFGLTASFQGNATTRCDYKWQARDYNPLDPQDWVDIKPDEQKSVTTAWADDTVSGFASIQSNFNSVPFEVRMQFRTNNATVGLARVKNSSYARYIYEIS